MRRGLASLAVFGALLPAGGTMAAVSVVPSSAYALPVFEITSSGKTARLTADDLGVRRTDHGLELDEARLDQAVAKLGTTLGVPPRPGTYELKDGRVLIKDGSPGIALDPKATREMLLRALRGSRSNLRLPTKPVPAPPAPVHAVVVRLSDFRLDLYQGPEVKQNYVVGVGALRFPTPPGVYFIRSKAINPSWRNPGSPWARSMPAYIPPGPRNPLGTRALRLDRGALVIHGTPQPWSIGQRSSHGCIRMKREDVERLYEAVPEGTPVFIVP